MNYCKFDCPFKNKTKINEVLIWLRSIMNNDDLDIEQWDKEIVLEDVQEEMKYIGCNLCPLNDFINRLENEKIIKE